MNSRGCSVFRTRNLEWALEKATFLHLGRFPGNCKSWKRLAGAGFCRFWFFGLRWELFAGSRIR